MSFGVVADLQVQCLVERDPVLRCACIEHGGHISQRIDHHLDLGSGQRDRVRYLIHSLCAIASSACAAFMASTSDWVHPGFDGVQVALQLGFGGVYLGAQHLSAHLQPG
ncbi:hypothetical protein OG563_03695 [Nocardia vinacea]|uniref:Uncharacterized protein n=1 Tax=Nocardia vinacea TaxID=96468 RepID=A0ABZ1YVP1_9NOCA|nr:hypothetical protein [Nocardia vinacea]